MTKPPINDAVAALRANYAKKVPEKLAELNEAARGLRGDDPMMAVQAVRDLTHKLAGSAPSFGFSDLGAEARVIEQRCDALKKSGGSVGDDAIEALETMVRGLHAFDEQKDENGEQGATPDAAVAPTLSGRVWVVDDEPTQALYVKVILQKAGIDVVVEGDPLKVGALLDDTVPDLILLDMNMPGMSGDELAQRIRARDDAAASCPIVFLSGEEDADRQVTAIVAGGNGFVTKPVRPDELIKVVGDFLSADSGENR